MPFSSRWLKVGGGEGRGESEATYNHGKELLRDEEGRKVGLRTWSWTFFDRAVDECGEMGAEALGRSLLGEVVEAGLDEVSK